MLILSIDYNSEERAIVTYVPRTTSVWGAGRFDVIHKARGMKDGAYAVQLIGSIPNAKFQRKIGEVSAEKLAEVEVALKLWLGL